MCIRDRENAKWIKSYDLYNSEKINLALKKVCDQFIHSKYFSAFVPKGLGCVGTYFVSDYDFEKHIYYLRLVDIVNIFLSVSKEEVVNLDLKIEGSIIEINNFEKNP